MPRSLSPKLPLSYHPSDGYAMNKEFGEMIKQNLKMLILTNPGERIMIPSFGVGLKRFLFEPNIDVESRIAQKIGEQVNRYMPFVEVQEIIFGDSATNAFYDSPSPISTLNVKVRFVVVPIDLEDYIELSVSTN